MCVCVCVCVLGVCGGVVVVVVVCFVFRIVEDVDIAIMLKLLITKRNSSGHARFVSMLLFLKQDRRRCGHCHHAHTHHH